MSTQNTAIYTSTYWLRYKRILFIIQAQLRDLTKAEIKQSDIAKALNVGKANISLRIKNKSKLTYDEIKKIEAYFNVSVYTSPVNSLERYFDSNRTISPKGCGTRFLEIQTKNNISVRQFAGILDISEDDLLNIISGNKLPDWKTISNLKQNFRVSLDWLIYGE